MHGFIQEAIKDHYEQEGISPERYDKAVEEERTIPVLVSPNHIAKVFEDYESLIVRIPRDGHGNVKVHDFGDESDVEDFELETDEEDSEYGHTDIEDLDGVGPFHWSNGICFHKEEDKGSDDEDSDDKEEDKGSVGSNDSPSDIFEDDDDNEEDKGSDDGNQEEDKGSNDGDEEEDNGSNDGDQEDSDGNEEDKGSKGSKGSDKSTPFLTDGDDDED